MAKAKYDDVGIRTMEIILGLPEITSAPSSSSAGPEKSSASGNAMVKGDVGNVTVDSSAHSGGQQTVIAKIDDERIIQLEKVVKGTKERLIKMEENVAGFKMDMSDMMQKLASMESNMGDIMDVREGLSTMERTMRELSSLYDLISAQFNPFIEVDKKLQKKK